MGGWCSVWIRTRLKAVDAETVYKFGFTLIFMAVFGYRLCPSFSPFFILLFYSQRSLNFKSGGSIQPTTSTPTTSLAGHLYCCCCLHSPKEFGLWAKVTPKYNYYTKRRRSRKFVLSDRSKIKFPHAMQTEQKGVAIEFEFYGAAKEKKKTLLEDNEFLIIIPFNCGVVLSTLPPFSHRYTPTQVVDLHSVANWKGSFNYITDNEGFSRCLWSLVGCVVAFQQ